MSPKSKFHHSESKTIISKFDSTYVKSDKYTHHVRIGAWMLKPCTLTAENKKLTVSLRRRELVGQLTKIKKRKMDTLTSTHTHTHTHTTHLCNAAHKTVAQAVKEN